MNWNDTDNSHSGGGCNMLLSISKEYADRKQGVAGYPTHANWFPFAQAWLESAWNVNSHLIDISVCLQVGSSYSCLYASGSNNLTFTASYWQPHLWQTHGTSSPCGSRWWGGIMDALWVQFTIVATMITWSCMLDGVQFIDIWRTYMCW